MTQTVPTSDKVSRAPDTEALSVLVLTPLFPVRPGQKLGNFVLDQVKELSPICRVSVAVTRAWMPPFLREKDPQRATINTESYRHERFTVETLRYFSLPRYWLGTLAAPFMRIGLLPGLRRMVRERGVQIIHAHGIGVGFVAQTLAREFNIPYLVTVHGAEDSPRFANSASKRRQIGDMLEQADSVILVGSPLALHLERFVSSTRNFVVVPNGFQVFEGITPSTRIAKCGFRVVTAANLDANKGLDYLIRAVAVLSSRIGKELELVIVGNGPEREALTGLARDLGIASRVHFTGFLSHQETEAEILAGDVFCLPAWREAFGVVYLEAMALRRPTVGCRGQGPSDFITHEATGYLVEPMSVDSIVQTLQSIIEHPADAARVAAAGQSKVFAQLTWRHNAATMQSLYRNLVAGRNDASC